MRNRRLAFLGVGIAVLVLIVGVVAIVGSDGTSSKYFRYTSATKLDTLIPVKDRKAPKEFNGVLLSGAKETVPGTPGKVTLVNFWASWCGPCTAETPEFDLLYRQVRSRGVDFIGIATKDTRSAAAQFVSNYDISYPIVIDQPGEALLTLGNFPSDLPFTLLVDKQGRIAAVYVARLTTKDLEGPIDTLLASG